MKKVLFIRSNPVNPDPRVEKEANSLLDAGYDVSILAWNRSENSGRVDSTMQIGKYIIPIIKMGYAATFGEGKKNLKAFVKFQFSILRYLLANRQYDVIHACDFDTAFTASIATGLTGKKFVFDIFDFIAGRPKNSFEKIVRRTEISLINKSDATIICTEKREEQIAPSQPKRLEIIHNSPASQMLEASFEPKREMLKGLKYVDTSRTRIAYVGILQDYRLLKEILECVSEHPDIELHIGGFGKYEELIVQISEQFENITFYGKLEYTDTIYLESNCDIMLAVYDPAIENHEYAAPNKFYEGLFLGKPLVMVKNTGMSDVVAKEDIGVLIDYSKEGFYKGIKELISRNAEWVRMSSTMQQLYTEKFSWDIMDRRLVGMYHDICSSIRQ